MSKSAKRALAEIRPVNKRVLVVTFSGNPMTTVIVNYAPTEGSDVTGAHYETLSSTVNEIPKHHVIKCRDFNAHLRSDKSHHSCHKITNEKGICNAPTMRYNISLQMWIF